MKRFALLLTLALLLIGAAPGAFAQQRPDAPAFARRGPYAVGTRELVIADAGRPLNVTIWYPALNPDNLPQQASYAAGIMSGEGRALRDAAPDAASGPFPLVVFSHGLSGLRLQSIFLTEHLASYGFVVMAADHPGSTLFDVLLNFTSDPAAGIIESFALRPLEVLREIDFAAELSAGDGDFAGVIDADNVAVAGHSFGGYTALAAGGARLDFESSRTWCADPVGLRFDPNAAEPFAPLPLNREDACAYALGGDAPDLIAAARGYDPVPDGLWPSTTDPRIRALVALAPSSIPSFGPAGLAEITVPALIMVGSLDRATVPEYNAYLAYQQIASAQKALVVFENAGHYVFIEECPQAAVALGFYTLCSDLVWDMDRIHDLTNHFAAVFLRATFYADPAAIAALDGSAVDFAGVDYLTASGG